MSRQNLRWEGLQESCVVGSGPLASRQTEKALSFLQARGPESRFKRTTPLPALKLFPGAAHFWSVEMPTVNYAASLQPGKHMLFCTPPQTQEITMANATCVKSRELRKRNRIFGAAEALMPGMRNSLPLDDQTAPSLTRGKLRPGCSGRRFGERISFAAFSADVIYCRG